ncbi:MAG: type II toxin-antitoxin system VapC family toxin [Acidobacteria bacterium]|nr:type II toxin-antitoxin system VapC family toxin [Acidobacteriota bacterium]
MILLDTNVVSAVMKPLPNPVVLRWLDRPPVVDLYLSSITIAEIGFGLNLLPEGRRRRDLETRFELFVHRGFEDRILPFDEPAAREYAKLMSLRRRIGRPMSSLDGQIAAIARAHGFAVATGNVRDFEDVGVEVLEPFAEENDR